MQKITEARYVADLYGPVDLTDDGVLWMINRTIFHPRGFALAMDDSGNLAIQGNGSEPWKFGLTDAMEDEKFAAFERLLATAARALTDGKDKASDQPDD